jgi:hypothetical protein
MQTLHDMLRDQLSTKGAKVAPPREDLRHRYSKIGISAVAAAAQFHNGSETKVSSLQTAAPADRSSARGWSGHR